MKAAVFAVVAVFCTDGILFAANDAAPPVPAAVAEPYAEARKAMDAGDFAAAAKGLEEALKSIAPGTDGINLLRLALGNAWLRAGEHAKAIAPLELVAASDATVFPLLGDALRGAGRFEDARRAYERAADGESLNARYSRARISELAGAAEVDQTAAVELLFNAADAFTALGAEDVVYFDEAAKLYESIIRNRKWRGEATARAIFSMGELERLRKRLPEAIAYYQRCFVTWMRYPKWCARAYMRASECFEALGRRPEAMAHLRELVRKADKYGKFPEFNEAKNRLRAWGDIVP